MVVKHANLKVWSSKDGRSKVADKPSSNEIL